MCNAGFANRNPELPHAIWALFQRLDVAEQPEKWWAERRERIDLAHANVGSVLLSVYHYSRSSICTSAQVEAALLQFIPAAMHIVKMNRAARMSCFSKMPFMPVYASLGIVASACSTPGQRAKYLSAGMAEAALFAVENNFSHLDLSLATPAAMMAVNLIGHNEGGLTLTRAAVDAVLDL